VDLPEVAADLYALAPDQFVGARDARAAEARKAGDRALAADIKKLRRPTAGAWLVNLLVRERRADIDQLLTLGTALRDAQAQLDADELRRLSQQRHQLVSTLVKEAVTIGRDRGQVPGDAAQREAEATLEAALADPAAAAALASGRLTVALHYSGFGSVDVTDAVAAPAAVAPDDRPAPPPRASGRAATTKAAPADRRRERRDAAEQELRIAEAAIGDAERSLDEHRRAAAEAAATRDELAAEIAGLERGLDERRSDHEQAERAARAAESERASAERAADAARDRARRARAALDRLSS
jgi:DNA repair exonuclease SbcCD ATPase subunit